MTRDNINHNRRENCQRYEVGNFVLHSIRNCEEARERLGLSHREVELVIWVGSGITKREIAKKMGVSEATADTFRRRAYAKLGVSTGSAAVAIMTAFLAGTRVDNRKQANAA